MDCFSFKGKFIWSEVQNHAGCRTAQTKATSSLIDGSTKFMIPVNLPGGPYLVGDLLSISCHSNNCSHAWLKHLKISYDARVSNVFCYTIMIL